MNGKLLLILVCTGLGSAATAQYTTDKVAGKRQADLADSIKKTEYPHLLPIWGQKATQKGFQLPLPGGLSVQYISQESDIIIDNLQVGFNNGPLYNVDDIIRFTNARSNSKGANIRPDFWLFPFLNVYGIFAQSRLSTTIDAGVWLPDDETWTKVTDLHTKAEFDATTFGFGLTPTVGVGGFFLVLDMNFTWSDIAELDDPAFAFVFGPRLGKNFKLKKPDQQVAFWAGAFRVKINSGTQGSLALSDLFAGDEWAAKIDTGYMKLASNQQKVDTWWESLTPAEQKNPANIAKHETADAVLARFGGVLDAASQAVTNIEGTTVQYSLDKKPKDMWNFILGTQFQINRNLMFRAEYGFLGSRQQFIGGIQYRFGF